MWKSSSRGITAKLRAVSRRTVDARCGLATESAGEPKSDPPKDEFKVTEKGQEKKKSKGSARKLFFGALTALTAAAGGVVGYAWYNHEFREKVATQVPYSKDAFDAVFVFLPESPSVPAPLLSKERDQSVKTVKPVDDQTPSFMKKKPVSEEPAPVEKVAADSPAPAQEKDKPVVPEKKLTDKEIQENKKKAEKEAQEKKKVEAAAENAAMEVAVESLMNVSATTVEKALSALDEAIAATKKHTEMLRASMNERPGGSDDGGKWDAVVAAYESLQVASDAGDKALAQAWENVEKLRSKVESGRENNVTKTNRVLNTARDKHNKLRQELTRKIEQLSKVERDSNAQLQFKSLVEKGKQEFKKELESLSPDVKIAKGGKVTENELNIMIAHAHKRIEQLQTQLAAQAAFEQQRTDLTLEQQKERDQRKIDDAVQDEKERMKFQLDSELQEKEKEIKDKYHKAMIDERYRMEEWKDRETERKMSEQKEELTEKYQQIMEVVKINEREEFLAEMSEWIGRIKGFDRAISARAETEELAEQAQKLWLSCLALNGSIRVGNFSGDTWETQLKPLEKEVDAVFDAAQNNPFILLVLQTVPEKALTRGVYTEDNLKARFEKVHRVAKRVALIDETGGSLFKYFVSYMQSFLIGTGTYTVSAKSEVDEIDIAKMDTFDILKNARYWMEKGDLELALRFMNLLKGESRRVAADWIEETRLLLETRQASFTLMAFASAQGLGTLF